MFLNFFPCFSYPFMVHIKRTPVNYILILPQRHDSSSESRAPTSNFGEHQKWKEKTFKISFPRNLLNFGGLNDLTDGKIIQIFGELYLCSQTSHKQICYLHTAIQFIQFRVERYTPSTTFQNEVAKIHIFEYIFSLFSWKVRKSIRFDCLLVFCLVVSLRL